MTEQRAIYWSQPEQYDELVRHEDREGNLLEAIRAITSLEGADVVEFGAGTGRLTMLLAPRVRSIRAFDIAAPMVEVARRNLARLGTGDWEVGVADNAHLPVPSCSADIAIAGWTYGHQTVWHPTSWRTPIEGAIQEMFRVLCPGGTAIVIETLGTGYPSPFVPPAPLASYYAMLVDEYQFEQRWIRTDYEFPSMEEGSRLIRFFFGDEQAERFAAGGSSILAECTGIWWRRRPPSPKSTGGLTR
ncbi:MAG: methyltransferase domain-containing protein [Bradymonadales bacterium]|nr:methyltransferase domain-containing protein [Bradymonadales bacterium]